MHTGTHKHTPRNVPKAQLCLDTWGKKKTKKTKNKTKTSEMLLDLVFAFVCELHGR